MRWTVPCVTVMLVLVAADAMRLNRDYDEDGQHDQLFGRRQKHIRSPQGDDSFVFPGEVAARPARPARPTRPTKSRPTPSTTRRPVTTQSNCECLATPEFNPVCGTNAVTYSNPGRLKCARYCGQDVELNHYGNCVTTPAP